MYKSAPPKRQCVLLGGRAGHLHYRSPGHTLLAETGALLWANGNQSVPYHEVVFEILTVALGKEEREEEVGKKWREKGCECRIQGKGR